eukprot:GHVT01094715.1.p1 GENE.GHVT01094715.1~~GHVT01094715.1.p1  ORF type:complete len:399 (-),score=109.34 GHVT01094715.1:135-1331(-)
MTSLPPAGTPQFACSGDDDEFDWQVTPEYLAVLKEKYKGEEFPIFMDDISEEKASNNPHVQALQSIAFDEDCGPKAQALRYKRLGNEWAAAGSGGFGRAISFYSRALQDAGDDNPLRAKLLANRALLRLKRKEFVDCINDCREAIKRDPTCVKAYYRGAEASLALELSAQALAFASRGLAQAVGPEEEPPMERLRARAEQLQSESKRKKKIEQERAAKQEMEKVQGLRVALHRRGLVVGKNSYAIPLPAGAKIYVEESKDAEEKEKGEQGGGGDLHWPVLLLYDEYNTSDVICDCSEQSSLMEHLQHMFPSSSSAADSLPFAPWDVNHKYLCDSLVAFIEDSLGKLHAVPLDVALGRVLAAVPNIPGLPIFHILASTSSAALANLRKLHPEIQSFTNN